MTREFNKNQRYDSRPPYRGTPPSNNNNNRSGAEQPSGPTRPRLNRAMVDRAWENGAPHRHADYKARNPNEAGTNQTQYGPNAQRNWRKPQPSEHGGNNNSFHERGNGAHPSRYDSRTQPQRSDSPSNGYQGSRSRFTQPNNSFTDRPPYRDQRGNGNEENTYPTRNGHPNFSHTPPQTSRGRYNQEPDRQGPSRNGPYSYRANPTNRVNNANADRGDQRGRPYDQRETPYRNNRFEGQGRQYTDNERPTDFNKPRYPSNPPTPGRQRENRNVRPPERFEGDYEQFNHTPAPSRPPRDTKKQERPEYRAPQPHVKRTGKPVEPERHVTPLPDGRVLKGPRPAQRKNAQFWTGISQDTEQLVNHVQTNEETFSHIPAKTAITDDTAEKVVDGQLPTTDVPEVSEEQIVPTGRTVSPRAKAAKRAASAARRGKSDKPASKGPRPSQRGFKWPTPPTGE